MCGDALADAWSVREIERAIVADHGYHKSSLAVRRLVAILAAFDEAERRAFARFVTGAPRLPTGGLCALSPPLTVVRKEPTDRLTSPDACARAFDAVARSRA